MAATALTGRGLLMAMREHGEGGKGEGEGRENGHTEEGIPARLPYGGFEIPAVPVAIAACPICHSRAFTIKRVPAMAVATVQAQDAEALRWQAEYEAWAALPRGARPDDERTVKEWASAHGVSFATMYRWKRGEWRNKKKRPYLTVPCGESAVVSCFSCGRDYLEYERGSREGWRKRPVRRWDGVILDDW